MLNRLFPLKKQHFYKRGIFVDHNKFGRRVSFQLSDARQDNILRVKYKKSFFME